MNRMDFIRLGTGASVVALVGTLPGIGATSVDALDRWAVRHKASVTVGKDGRNLVAMPAITDVGAALQELDELADGSLLCEGSDVRGIIGGQRFRVEMAAVS